MDRRYLSDRRRRQQPFNGPDRRQRQRRKTVIYALLWQRNVSVGR